MARYSASWSAGARSAHLVELLQAQERLAALVQAEIGEWDREQCWAADDALSPVSWLMHRVPLTRQDAMVLVRTARHVVANEHTVKALDVGDIDFRGKFVVTEGFGMPGKVSFFEARGALGMIAVNPGKNAHWGICTTVWGTPDLRDLPRKPKIAVVAVNNPDGLQLIEAAKRGESATLTADLIEGWFKSPVPVVTIPGTDEPEAFVLLHGHYDSWDFGIGDNAVGDATL